MMERITVIEDDSDGHEDIVDAGSSFSQASDPSSSQSLPIADFTSPLKNEDLIVEIDSPDGEKKKTENIRDRSFKKSFKRLGIKRKLTDDRPPLCVNVSKKTTSAMLGLEVNSPACFDDFSSKVRGVYKAKTSSKSALLNSTPSWNPLTSQKSELFRESPIAKASSPPMATVFPEDHGPHINTKEDNKMNDSFKAIQIHNNDVTIDYSEGMIDNPPDSQPVVIEDASQEVAPIEYDLVREVNISTTPQKPTDLLVIKDISSEEITSGNKCLEQKPLVGSDVTPLDESSVSIIKNPKKGTFLEKAYKVLSSMKKDSALFSHEISVGLRAKKGPLVSDILVVRSVSSDENCFLVECEPSNSCPGRNSSLQSSHLYSKLILLSNELSKDVKADSELVVHLPVLILFDAYLKVIFIFIENKIQGVSNTSSQSFLAETLNVNTLNVMDSKKIIRNFKSRTCKNVLDAVVGSLLVSQFSLELNVLHVFSERENIVCLAIDSEAQTCLVLLNNTVVSNIDPPLNVNSVYVFTGFTLSECCDFKGELKFVAEYYSNYCSSNKYMYTFVSISSDSKVQFVKKSELNHHQCSLISSSLLQAETQQRIRVLVKVVKYVGSQVLVGEHEADLIEIIVELPSDNISLPSPIFFLEAVYFREGGIIFDKFSRIEIS